MEISTDFSIFSKGKDGEDSFTPEQLGAISRNIGKIYEIVAKLVTSWDAYDEAGKMIDITPDTVAFVL